MPALYLLPHTVHVTFSLPWNWWAGKDSNLRRQKPADLQSAPFGRLGTYPRNSRRSVRRKEQKQGAGDAAAFFRTHYSAPPRRPQEAVEPMIGVEPITC